MTMYAAIFNPKTIIRSDHISLVVELAISVDFFFLSDISISGQIKALCYRVFIVRRKKITANNSSRYYIVMLIPGQMILDIANHIIISQLLLYTHT